MFYISITWKLNVPCNIVDVQIINCIDENTHLNAEHNKDK